MTWRNPLHKARGRWHQPRKPEREDPGLEPLQLASSIVLALLLLLSIWSLETKRAAEAALSSSICRAR